MNNENDANGISNILKAAHEYVPTAMGGNDKVFDDLAIFVGYQLTVERCVNAHNTLLNGFYPEERLYVLFQEKEALIHMIWVISPIEVSFRPLAKRKWSYVLYRNIK